MASTPGPVTPLLVAWTNGDRPALDELIPVVYPQLRRIAARYLRRECGGHKLQPTALVHEATVKRHWAAARAWWLPNLDSGVNR